LVEFTVDNLKVLTLNETILWLNIKVRTPTRKSIMKDIN